MKRTTNGFGVVEGLLIVAVVGLIGAVGYIVYDKTQNKDDETDTAQTTQKKADDKKVKNTVALDTTIHDVDITLKTEADLAKLPSYTPDSFREYLASELRDNKPETSGEVTLTKTWEINKISQFNIKGGIFNTDDDGETYPGGAPLVWVISPSGTWGELGINSSSCTTEAGGKVYEEFVAICYDETANDYIANPNGSITTVNQ